MKAVEVRDAVRNHYATIAKQLPAKSSSCGCAPSCCSPNGRAIDVEDDSYSAQIGYTPEERAAVPVGTDMGLGCGNPQVIAALKEGEVVVDLGSGGGLDCFLAAQKVGPTGRVIGVDMTPEMINRARRNVQKSGVKELKEIVEFRLGEIEKMPIDDNVADVVISNCVINLSPEKENVFAEIFRVLKAGGRVAVSDVVALQEMPADLKQHTLALSGCVSGASAVDDLQKMMRDAGFIDINIDVDPKSHEFIASWIPEFSAEKYIASAKITARKPDA